MSKINLPNKLTIFRALLIVPFVVLLLGGHIGWFGENEIVPDMIALVIFVIACITDFFDGMIARKNNLITNFGKFMDPLADKLLVCSALIALVELGRIPAWIVIIIISREFIISGFRLIASDKGVVIAASYWGKFKTVTQMIMVGMMISNFSTLYDWFGLITSVMMYVSLGLTIISLIDYLIKNRDVMKDTK